MRRDNIELSNPDSVDRPGDRWIRDANGTNETRVLTWVGRRRLWTRNFLVVVALVAIASLTFVSKAQLFRPGDLSTPHAQILAGALAKERCGACHSQAALSPLAWFRSGGDAHMGVHQDDLCIKCHHGTIPENLAYSAHNLPLSVRDQLTESIRFASARSGAPAGEFLQQLLPDAAIDQNDVTCGTCHKEHHGAEADLTSMSNHQCQTCHSARFNSFAQSHPDWQGWPYGRGGEISFNHVTHQNIHFPSWQSGAQAFDCRACHPSAAARSNDPAVPSSELVRVTSYEESCGGCHDASMKLQIQKGTDFISLPTLPESAVANVDGWPENATGFTDGVIPPLSELLMRADPELSAIMRQLPRSDVSQLSNGAEQSHEQLSRLAMGHRTLMRDFGLGGHAVLHDRLRAVGISPGPFRNVLHSLSPQLVDAAHQRWFTDRTPSPVQEVRTSDPTETFRLVVAEDQDALLVDSPSDELPQGDPLDPPSETLRESRGNTDNSAAGKLAAELVSDGGWFIDDLRMAVRYRGQGHADPVIVGMIETFSQLSQADPLKKRFFEDALVSACVSCHPAALLVPPRWKTQRQIGQRSDFTKFSHRPHLNVSALGDCVYCHRVRSGQSDHAEISQVRFSLNDNTMAAPMEFEPLDRQSCAACHTAAAAGDNCTKCHRYHIAP